MFLTAIKNANLAEGITGLLLNLRSLCERIQQVSSKQYAMIKT
jgi:hypothetical protein